jgi:nanoRNase/pAp phosphatase (c-di-AMP/oligoRNAs hydrolase)
MTRSLVVTAKRNPDLDGVACAVGYAELLRQTGEHAVAVLAGEPDAEARFILSQVQLQLTSVIPEDTTSAVLVDMSALPGLPEFLVPEDVIEVIDHRLHGDPAQSYPNAIVQVEAVGAAATLVFERFSQAGIPPSRESAILLQAAIQSNTQRLQGSVTTPRDVEAARALQALHSLSADLVAEQFKARGAEIYSDVPAALLRETKTFEHVSGTFQVAQLECPGALDLVALVRSLPSSPRTIINLVDPLLPASAILVIDPDFRAWVASQAGVTFRSDTAKPDRVLLRKQLVARLLGTGGGP